MFLVHQLRSLITQATNTPFYKLQNYGDPIRESKQKGVQMV